MSMSIHDEAVSAALEATNAAGYRHITALSVVAILEAASPHMRAREVREISERVGKRYAHLHQMLRDELQEQAWNEGAFSEHDFDGTPTGTNPYQRNLDEME